MMIEGGDTVADLTPLERARLRQKRRTCTNCPDRVMIDGVSYCGRDGKLLHPMLLEYPGPCPIEQREEANGNLHRR